MVYAFHATQDELVATTTDAAEGLIDVPKIAAQLKGWAFDEIDTLPDH